MKVKAVKSFSGVESLAAGETREVSPSPVWDDLIRVGYVRVIPEELTGKETAKNGNRKSKSGVQRKKRVNG